MELRGQGQATLCAARFLSLIVMVQSYYYFSASVSFFQIPDGLRDLTQLVTLVDNRCYFSGLHELAHDGQSSLFDLAINVTNFWLTNGDNADAVIARAKGPIIHGPLGPPTAMSIPLGVKTPLSADNEWFPTQSKIRS